MKTNRRQFIVNTGKAAVAMSALPLLLECAGMRRRDCAPCENAGAGPELSPQERGILCLASLAPSGHNTQPWTLRKTAANRWIIGSARERWLPAVDPDNRELLLSIGAFLENLVSAAGHFGYRAEVRITARSAHDAGDRGGNAQSGIFPPVRYGAHQAPAHGARRLPGPGAFIPGRGAADRCFRRKDKLFPPRESPGKFSRGGHH